MPFAIRTVTIEDIAEMHRIRTSVAENRLSDPERVGEESYRSYLLERGRGWVAEDEGTMLGFAVIDVRTESVWALFVHPEAEARGVGKALMAQLIAFAAAAGMERVSLTTTPGTRAERFYERSGWRRLGDAPGGEVAFELTLGQPSTALGNTTSY